MNQDLLAIAVRAHQDGNLAEAARLYSELLRANPRHFHALFGLAFVHLQDGQFPFAEKLASDAIRLNPRSPQAFYVRGSALQKMNRLTESIACFDQALAAMPDFNDALISRATSLMMLGRNEQALGDFDAANARDPSIATVWNNRGTILLGLDRREEALASFERAIAIAPDSIEAMIGRGTVLGAFKRYEEAARDFEAALALAPNHPYLRGQLAYYRLYSCDWRNLDEDRAAVATGLAANERVISPFICLALSYSPADQLQAGRIWAADKYPPQAAPLWRGERYNHKRIRVAYVSADFNSHATSLLMAGLFELHDRAGFETIAISFGRDDGSELRARVAAGFEHFVDVRGKSDAEIAMLMRQMEVDIAVDLKGYTLNSRPGIFAARPAPVQASYLGFPGTMGAPYIDYILADRFVIPDSSRRYYSESVVYLPDSYYPNDGTRAIPEGAPTREAAGLPESGFVFCCFNNGYKLTPEIFTIWMRLLQEIPGSVLWLLEDDPAATKNLRREVQAQGVAPERLVFAPRIHASEHLARHRLADLSLDTLPYNEHTTACDALWAGLPVLTCVGSTFVGRVGASLLSAVGLPELIVETLEAYEAMALKLAREPDTLAAIKEKLVRNRLAAPLFDTMRLTRSFEAAFATMYERYRRGEPPTDIAVHIEEGDGPSTPHISAAPVARPAPRLPSEAAPVYFIRGYELQLAGCGAEALVCFETALELDPNFAAAHVNRGGLLLEAKRFDEALASLDAALALDPSLMEAWNNHGNALSSLGRYAEAVASYDKIVAVLPDIPQPLINRGSALAALGRHEEALANFDAAILIDGQSAEAANGRANALFELKRFEEALAGYERTLALDPDRAYVRGILAYCRLKCCDWSRLEADRAAMIFGIRSGVRIVDPFQNLALSSSPSDQFQCSRIWAADKFPPSATPLWRGERYNHERIRIAYLSADFRNHAVAFLLAGIPEHHDRTRFETIAVSFGANDKSEIRGRLERAFDRFIEAGRESDAEIARILRDLEIDIAVDLMGYTAGHRTGILALRPAPIQANYLGYPGTMGAPYIDYLIADRIVIPEHDRVHYREQIAYLPDSYQCNDSKRGIAQRVPSRSECGLPENGFVFASFNNSYKIAPDIFAIWMRLLGQVEGSALWLLQDNEAAARNLRSQAEARGIAPERLVFAQKKPLDEHLARLKCADLFLDTLPYGAHTTASDALWAGLAVLTALGGTFAGRVAASLLTAVGLPEMIAADLSEYERLALELARDPAALAALKAKLAHNRLRTPLFDTERFTRNLEAVYTAMWERQNRGEPPALID